MSGLLRRIRATRSTATDPAPDEGDARPEAEPAREGTAGGEPGGELVLPAGADLDALVGERPSSQRRGRLRRRLRHLRRVREVLLRDLGGLVLEVHRAGAEAPATDPLVATKLERLDALTAELRELEDVLGDHRGRVLREPGIGGTCPLCGELHGSDARFCWACGTPVAPGAARPVIATGSVPALGAGATREWASPPEPPADADADADADTTVIEGSSEDL